MIFVEVAVNATGGLESTFAYSCEDESVEVGSLLLVPFGTGQAQGVVVERLSEPPPVAVRPVSAVVEPLPVLRPVQVSLARWIADYYCCPLIDALTLMLPPGLAQRPHTMLSRGAVDPPANLSEAEALVLAALAGQPEVNLARARRLLRQHGLARQTDRAVRRLVRLGALQRAIVVNAPRVGIRYEWFASLAVPAADLDPAREALGRAPRQRALLDRLAAADQPLPLPLLRDEGVGDLQTARALVERGFARLERQEVRRDPLAHRLFPRAELPRLSPAQAEVIARIEAAIDAGGFAPCLLFGVTGSGKTEVYLRTIAALLQRGRRAIVLVPEIALTPQTIQRFAGRFPGRVAVLHSRLSDGERFDEWRRIRLGEADVVVGSRSALFAPVPQLGAIVLDEEHEWSYKQDNPPRYHARDVALKLGELAGVPVILGSATPALETFHRARREPFTLLTLPERVVVGPDQTTAALPPVEVVDLRTELKEGNRSIFSASLRTAVDSALRLREQVILFLNRRGDSTFVLCRDCGYVMCCRRCDAPFVYHSDVEYLVCHLCDARAAVPRDCPECGGERIRFFGIGTQKLEAETRRAFPEARVLRWDRDAARARGAHDEILRSFTNHEADILVGTQMIAKGLDLPRVTLVGVVSADTSLHLPDFRAAERTFQLLTQVAGRAGRGPLGGRVILQTYSPEHYCIQAARVHDYPAFYQHEISFRQEHGYPPFGQLARLLYLGQGEERVRRAAETLAAQIRARIRQQALPDVEVIGPAPAFRHKIRGRYRWQIILRGHNLSPFVRGLALPLGWLVDVDPVSTL
ncbi:MAG TPA: primosomal protein N' [Chloroflexota bacterium]|nr:primosomal protein N' [Chloroflexota bacterium]